MKKLTTLLLATAMSVAMANNQLCVDSGLVSLWHGDGNTNDVVGSNNGTLMNGATFGTGKVGQAFSFDGINDYVNLGDFSSLTDATIDFWINPSSIVDDMRIIGNTTGSAYPAFTLRFYNGRIQQIWSSTWQDITTSSIAVGEWTHITIVITRIGNIGSATGFVNGVQELTVYDAPYIFTNLALGAPFLFIWGSYFHGYVDELAIFNRALSASEIQNLYVTADAGTDTTIFSGQSVQIGSAPVAGNTYLWNPAAGLNDATIANPIASPVSTTTYILTATDSNGCTAADTVVVDVLSQQSLSLGEASKFALLADGSISSMDSVFAYGKVGATGSISNLISASDSVLPNIGSVQQALNDINNLISSLNTAQNVQIPSQLGGLSLAPGFYSVASDVTLNGTLTLTGDSNSVYFFNIGNSGTQYDLTVNSSGFLKLGKVKPENIYWLANNITLEKPISFSGILMSMNDIFSEGENYGITALISQGDIQINGSTNRLFSQKELLENPPLFSGPGCQGYELEVASELSPTNNLIPCIQYDFIYKLIPKCDNDFYFGDITTDITINLPNGIEMVSSNVVVSCNTCSVTVTSSFPTASPVFHIEGWGNQEEITLTISVQTPPCKSITTPSPVTTVAGTGMNPTPVPVNNILSIGTSDLTVDNLSGNNGILLLNTGDVTELVFKIKNVSDIGTTIDHIQLIYTPDQSTQLLGYYIDDVDPVTPIPVWNQYTYTNTLLTLPSCTPPCTLDIGCSNFTDLFGFGTSTFPYNEYFYLHIAIQIPCSLSSISNVCGNSNSSGSYDFYWGCAQTPCGNTQTSCGHVLKETAINVLTNAPNLHATPQASTPATFCPGGNNVTSVSFQYTNTTPISSEKPLGHAKATDIILYLYCNSDWGTLDNLAINGVSLPTSILTISEPDANYPNYNVYKIDFSILPESWNGWNPFGTGNAITTIADLDGDGYVDDLNEQDDFTITAEFTYNTTCSVNFPSCGGAGAFLPAVQSRYNDQCFSVTTSCIGNCGTQCPFNPGCPDAAYSYSASGGGDGIIEIISPNPPGPTHMVEGDFYIVVDPGKYREAFSPSGFDFCPNGFHQIVIPLQPGFHFDALEFSPLIVTLFGPCTGDNTQTATVYAEEISGSIYVTFEIGIPDGIPDRLPLDNGGGCPNTDITYRLPGIVLPLYLECINNYDCANPPGDPCTYVPEPGEDFGGIATLSYNLQYICDVGVNCLACSPSIECESSSFQYHCCGPCDGYFGTKQNTFEMTRQTLGFVNSPDEEIDYYNSCTNIPNSSGLDSTAIDLDAAYPGDIIHLEVQGSFSGSGSCFGVPHTGVDYQEIYLQIRYDNITGGNDNDKDFIGIDGTQGSITIFYADSNPCDPNDPNNPYTQINTCNGGATSIVMPASDLGFSSGIINDGGDDDGKKFINIIFSSAGKSFLCDENITYYFCTDLNLIFYRQDFPSGVYKINPDADFMGTRTGGVTKDKSCDHWGTPFVLQKPSVSYGIAGGTGYSCCGIYNFEFVFRVPMANGDFYDFPNEFRPYAALDSQISITIPAGYEYDNSTDFVMNHIAFDNLGTNNFGTNFTTLTATVNPVNEIDNGDGTTTLEYTGLDNSCWPLLDVKWWPPLYKLVVRTKVKCTALPEETFTVEGGYTVGTNQGNSLYQEHFDFSPNPLEFTVINNKPDMVVVPPNGTNAYDNIVEFNFLYCNQGCEANAAWVAFETPDNTLNFESVYADLNGDGDFDGDGETLPTNMYDGSSLLANVGTINANDCIALKLTASINNTGCVLTGTNPEDDVVNVLWANECDGTIIAEPSESTCPVLPETLQFQFLRFPSDLTLTITQFETTQADLCNGTLTYELIVEGSELGTVTEPGFSVDLPINNGIYGITVEELIFTYPIVNGDQCVITSPSLPVNINIAQECSQFPAFAGLLNNGLPGTNNTDENKIGVEVTLNSNCDYSPYGGTISFAALGTSSCDEPIEKETQDIEPPIDGFSPPDELSISIDIPNAVNCSNGATITITVENLGYSTTEHDNEIIITIPAGFPQAFYDNITTDPSATINQNEITWNLDVLNPSEPTELTINLPGLDYAEAPCVNNLVVSATYGYTETISCEGGEECEKTFISDPPVEAPIQICCDCSTPIVAGISSQTDVSCNGGSNGAIDLTASGGTGTLQFLWSNGATTEDVSNLTAGTYTGTVTDANGCFITFSTGISQPPPIVIANTIITNVTCNGGSDGTATVSVAGGFGSLSYLWNTGATSQTTTDLAAGNYTVTISDAHACTITSSVTISQPAAISISFTKTEVSCNGGANGTATANASGGTTPYSYLWNTGATVATIFNLTSGTYSLTVTDGNNCTQTASVTIIQPAPLSLNITPTNVSCDGGNNGSATAIVSGGTFPYSYLWSNSSTGAAISGLSAGTYSVTVTDANGCSTSINIVIEQPDPLSVIISTDEESFCNYPFCTGDATANVTGGTQPYQYNWGNGETTQTASALCDNSFSYYIEVTDENNCSTGYVYFTTPSVPDLSLDIFQQKNVACNGGSDGYILVNASGGRTPYSYVWSNGSSGSGNNGQFPIAGVGLSAGTYTVTVTDNCGSTATLFAYVSEPPSPLILNLTTSNAENPCSPTGSITATFSGGETSSSGEYYIKIAGLTTFVLTTSPYTFQNLSPGTYTIELHDWNICTVSQTILIGPIFSVSATSTQTCFGGNTGTATATPSGGTAPYSYLWSNSQTGAIATGLAAGNYSVTVTDDNSCTKTASVTVTSFPDIALSTTTTNVSCYGGSNGAINLSVSGGNAPYIYDWNNAENTEDISGLSAGTYTVTVTDGNSCTKTTSVVITEPIAPLSLETSFTVDCSGGNGATATVSVTGGTTAYSYLWSNGVQTQNIASLTPGTYSVTVTDANGCTAKASVLVPAYCAGPSGVNIDINLCNAIASFSTTYSFKNILINGTYTISIPQNGGQVYFSNCAIYFGPNAKIIMPDDAYETQLQFNHSSLLAGCNYMWDGIYVEGITNTVNFSDGSNARDAENVIVSENGGIFKFFAQNYFYDNHIGIKVKPFAGTHSGILQGATMATLDNLIPPRLNQRTAIGVEITDVDDITIGVPGSAINTFQNIDVGIKCMKTVVKTTLLTVKNNKFENIKSKICEAILGGKPCKPSSGIAVWALGPNENGNSSFGTNVLQNVFVGGPNAGEANEFNWCSTGIKVEPMPQSLTPGQIIYTRSNVTVEGNKFTNITPIAPQISATAIFVRKPIYGDIIIRNHNSQSSYFRKIHTGVRIVDTKFALIDVDNNAFNMSSTNNTSEGSTAILVANAFPPFNRPVSIRNNNIQRMDVGIFLRNYPSGVSSAPSEQIYNNNILMNQAITNSSPVRYGILMENSNGLVENNTLRRTAAAPSALLAHKLRGIQISNSQSAIVMNNKLLKMGNGIYCKGNSNNSKLECNIFGISGVNNSGCVNGFVLDNTTVGQQGTSTEPQDNQWFSSSQFDIFGNGNTPENWYYRTGTSLMHFDPTPYSPDQFAQFPAILHNPLSNYSDNWNCSIGCLNPPCKQKKLAGGVNNQTAYANYVQENKYMEKENIFAELRNNPSLMQLGTADDAILQQFHDSILQTNMGKIREVHEHVAAGNLLLAEQKNSSIAPENLMQENHKKVNDVYLRTWAKAEFEFTDADKATLESVAYQKPIEGGKAVYSARVMLDLLPDDEAMAARMANPEEKEEPIALKNGSFVTKVYPNPNNGNMQIDYHLDAEQEGEIIIYDFTGKIISSHTLLRENSSLQIKENLSNGVYHYRIFVNKEMVSSEKLVIIR